MFVSFSYKSQAIEGKVEEKIKKSLTPLDLPAIKALEAEAGENQMESVTLYEGTSPHPILLLLNYCQYQYYSRTKRSTGRRPTDMALLRDPLSPIYPQFYFEVEMEQVHMGYIVIETRPDLAPKMAHNFEALCVAETGPSYKFCS